jgi:hypothetical protein
LPSKSTPSMQYPHTNYNNLIFFLRTACSAIWNFVILWYISTCWFSSNIFNTVPLNLLNGIICICFCVLFITVQYLHLSNTSLQNLNSLRHNVTDFPIVLLLWTQNLTNNTNSPST